MTACIAPKPGENSWNSTPSVQDEDLNPNCLCNETTMLKVLSTSTYLNVKPAEHGIWWVYVVSEIRVTH